MREPPKLKDETIIATLEAEIRLVIHRADVLGDQLRQAALPLVLCHADLHTWNVVLDSVRQEQALTCHVSILKKWPTSLTY